MKQLLCLFATVFLAMPTHGFAQQAIRLWANSIQQINANTYELLLEAPVGATVSKRIDVMVLDQNIKQVDVAVEAGLTIDKTVLDYSTMNPDSLQPESVVVTYSPSEVEDVNRTVSFIANGETLTLVINTFCPPEKPRFTASTNELKLPPFVMYLDNQMSEISFEVSNNQDKPLELTWNKQQGWITWAMLKNSDGVWDYVENPKDRSNVTIPVGENAFFWVIAENTGRMQLGENVYIMELTDGKAIDATMRTKDSVIVTVYKTLDIPAIAPSVNGVVIRRESAKGDFASKQITFENVDNVDATINSIAIEGINGLNGGETTFTIESPDVPFTLHAGESFSVIVSNSSAEDIVYGSGKLQIFGSEPGGIANPKLLSEVLVSAIDTSLADTASMIVSSNMWEDQTSSDVVLEIMARTSLPKNVAIMNIGLTFNESELMLLSHEIINQKNEQTQNTTKYTQQLIIGKQNGDVLANLRFKRLGGESMPAITSITWHNAGGDDAGYTTEFAGSTVSVNELPEDPTYRSIVWPNPVLAGNSVTLELQQAPGSSSVRVFNTAGEQLFATNVSSSASSTTEINVADFPAGSYYLMISNLAGVRTHVFPIIR